MKTVSRVRSAAVLACLMVAAFSTSILAQSSTGSITGTIVDSTGGGLLGATVTATQTDTGAVRSTTSTGTGVFTLPLLPIGDYSVAAELPGFAPTRAANVNVSVGGDSSVRLVMEPAGVQAAVTVTGEAPLIQATRSQVDSVVNERAIQNLPANGRNFIDFVLTTPGVVKDNFRVGDIVFAGQRGTLNSLVVDGADNNNTFFGQALGRTGTGRAPYQFSQDTVKEFQVNLNAYSAEYGRAGGAVINVVTKSGTNDFHGSGFYFYRDRKLNEIEYFDEFNNRPKAPYHYDQFGASLGGPIIRDKLFFFANYDGQRNTTPNTVVLNIPASTPSDPDTLAGIERLRGLADSWDRKQDQDTF
ncbi:MAG: carboxypeptidase regulatory-like domain-containing protein, partial [Thermoanaerobaculia bacterium]|nr:carboxypeptidase regulatory-like domain-containing protein [Thermoanaerobaculia bacterium]